MNESRGKIQLFVAVFGGCWNAYLEIKEFHMPYSDEIYKNVAHTDFSYNSFVFCVETVEI